MEQEFKIKQLPSESYRPSRSSKQHLCLFEKHLTYKAWSEGEGLDEETELWKPIKYFNWLFAEKANVSTIQLYWGIKTEYWHIDISMDGSTTDIVFDFITQDEAKDFYEKITAWKIK